MDLAKLIAKTGELIQRGQLASAIRILRDINCASVPDRSRLELARLCRRTGLIAQGLRLLNPRVRGTSDPTPNESVEYAILILRNGGVAEARKIAEGISPTLAPEVLFCLASVHVAQWDYATAKNLLAQYANVAPTPYAQRIARLNLGAAMVVTGDLEDARVLLDELGSAAAADGQGRLLANSLELRAQIAIEQRDFVLARRFLAEGRAHLGDGNTADQFHLRKWETIVSALESHNVDLLEAFRTEAIKRGDFESVRECDLYKQIICYDEDGFNFLVFGNPHLHYRERIFTKTGHRPSKERYDFGAGGACLNLATGELEGGAAHVPSGRRHHQLISALTRDFYAPVLPGELFALLFPREHFNPFSSPQKLRQSICRCRKWLRDEGLNLEITAENSRYSLSPSDQVRIRLTLDRAEVGEARPKLARLHQRFSQSWFTAREARSHLQMPLTTCRNVLRWGLDHHLLESRGRGSATQYRLAA